MKKITKYPKNENFPRSALPVDSNPVAADSLLQFAENNKVIFISHEQS